MVESGRPKRGVHGMHGPGATLALLTLLGVLFLPGAGRAEEPQAQEPGFRPLSDFETGTFDGWTVAGTAFGHKPARGAVERQQPVFGHLGQYLANSFVQGDGPRGALRSEAFLLDRPFLRLLVGGGSQGVRVELVVQGAPRFEATGEESETLTWRCWDVRPWLGKRARIVATDDSDGWWGHLLLDHVHLADHAGSTLVSAGLRRRIHDPSEGEKRPWYVNDHCFVRHPGGTWHLFGITHPEPADPLNEVLFAHATSKVLTKPGWRKHAPALGADPANADEQHIWAPHGIEHDGTWYLYYCAGDRDHHRYRIHLATSRDLKTWTRHPKNPLFQDGYDARDPFVLRVGSRWLLYYTATSEPEGGHHVVKVRVSEDLVAWSAPGIAFSDPAIGTTGGPTESPCVVQRGPWFYLFIGPRGGYVGTDVFRSLDPLNWSLADKVGHLHAHAAEVVRDEDGRWYVSHAGWGQGGVWLAPLYWADGL